MIRDDLAIHNERIKLRAASVNALALGLVGFALLRPLTSDPVAITWAAAPWTVAGLALHVISHYILSGLRKDEP